MQIQKSKYFTLGVLILLFVNNFTTSGQIKSKSNAPKVKTTSQNEKIKLEFDVPNEMEIQTGTMKETAKLIYKINGLEYKSNDVVLQQKGLNSFDPEAFKTYFRIILTPKEEITGVYAVINNKFEKKVKRQYYEQEAKKALLSNTTYLKTIPMENRQIAGIDCEVYGYERQMEGKPPVTVHHYLIVNKGKLLSLTASFRTAESEKWLPSIDKFLDYLTIKF